MTPPSNRHVEANLRLQRDRIARLRLGANVREIVTALGIRFRVGDGGKELTARCPSGKHRDKHPSWAIHNDLDNVNNGLFHCFTCKWNGDVFTLVQAMHGCEFLEAVEFVQKFAREISIERVVDEALYQQTFNTRQPRVARVPLGLRPIEESSDCWRYLVGRGIGRREINKFGLCDWAWRKRVYVPLHRKKILVSWLARSYDGQNPKVLCPKGDTIGTNWGIFGFDFLDRSKGEVNLVEGWASTIRVEQAGFFNPAGTCGAEISEEQAEDLSWAKRITVWKEGDAGGEAFEKSTRQWLGGGRQFWVVQMPEKKDPADFQIEELWKFFNARRQR